jgi:hypothetical protein
MELRANTVSGRTSGLNGYIPVDLNPAAENLGMAVLSKLRLIVLKIEVSQFLFKESPSCDCPDLHSNNISNYGKILSQWLESLGCAK